MTEKRWILTDTEKRLWVDHLDLGAGELGTAEVPSASVRKRTIRGGLSDVVDIIEVSNGAFAFTVLPTRGMGIWRGEYNGDRSGWDSPVAGPVHPAFVHLEEQLQGRQRIEQPFNAVLTPLQLLSDLHGSKPLLTNGRKNIKLNCRMNNKGLPVPTRHTENATWI